MSNLNPVRGMRDLYPEDMSVRNSIFSTWRTSAELFGFEAYDSCVVESLDLFKRKGGEEIVDQVYEFKDKSDRELALRPEITPSLARMVAARQGQLTFPLKWYTIGQCFRYERMTKGRKREHYQLNLDILGSSSTRAEGEILATAIHSLKSLGFTADQLEIKISSREILSALFETLNIPNNVHASAFLALDKRGKLDDDQIKDLLKKSGVSDNASASVFELLGLTNLNDVDEALKNNDATTPIKSLFDYLDHYGWKDWCRFDLSVVRGLGYYTGAVFECFERSGKSRAVFGGGRYDKLLEVVGGKPLQGVGLGFGDVVLSDLLEDYSLLPTNGHTDVTIGFMTDDEHSAAAKLAAELRHKGNSVNLGLKAEKAKQLFSRADKRNSNYAVYIGPDDVARGSVNLKRLSDGHQEKLDLN